MEELDKAKKDLEEIRAKAGLPEDDSKPDLEKLMAEERSKIILSSRQAERLLLKARNASANGKYEEAMASIEEAFCKLTSKHIDHRLDKRSFQGQATSSLVSNGRSHAQGQGDGSSKVGCRI